MEGSVQVFAGEYNASTLQVRNRGDEESPWVVTPGGAWCRGLYIAGALTEITESGDMHRCRVADPTGAFELVIGGRKTSLSDTIRNLPVPSFVTVLGQARMYQKGENFILSVRPDDVRVVDRSARDQWVLSTSESMLTRLESLHQALQNSSGDDRLMTACRHYALTPSKLLDLGRIVGDAVASIKPITPLTPDTGQPGIRDMVLCIVREAGGPRGIGIEEVIVKAAAQGLTKEAVLKSLESLITDDECYQPQKGSVKAL